MVQEVVIVKPRDPFTEFISKIFATIVVFGGISLGVFYTLKFMSGWETFYFPYKYAAAFYHYTVTVPVMTFPSAWEWLSSQNLTDYKNINLIISIIGIIGYFFIMIFLVSLIIGILNKMGMKSNVIFHLYFAPIYFSLTWLLGSLIFGWLFSLG